MARVLIADDDHLMRWSLERFLIRYGHVVDSVGSGSAVIDASNSGEYQVVISDYVMPEPNGLQVLRWVKRKCPQTHVILITARATTQMERLARDMGAFDFLEKPFALAAVKRAVDRAIATPERRKGPRGCCDGCEWQRPCGRRRLPQTPRPVN
jgi:DNA-binding NtrC family response regulator